MYSRFFGEQTAPGKNSPHLKVAHFQLLLIKKTTEKKEAIRLSL
ncbi:MAG: hypothetical protein V2I54_08625 [Bacteroidales bacterium]|jgi:hypothetical protein|nr:hypothetical protein [Bacteroidales bacterium]